MEIDLTNIPFGYETFYEMRRLQSGVIFRELNKMEKKFNYMIVGLKILRILEHSDRFQPSWSNFYTSYQSIVPDENMNKVGKIGEFEVYLDKYHPDDQISLSWDKQTSRDVKINSILEGINCDNKVKVKY